MINGGHIHLALCPNMTKKICTRSGPVHGHRDQMREIRAEATYVLNVLSLLHQLKPFFHNTQSVINIHTRSQGLINKSTRHINKPSLVTSDHIDLFYQI